MDYIKVFSLKKMNAARELRSYSNKLWTSSVEFTEALFIYTD